MQNPKKNTKTIAASAQVILFLRKKKNCGKIVTTVQKRKVKIKKEYFVTNSFFN
jgi:hypothetical protein